MNALRQFAASGALLRTKAMLIKEFIQLRRDKVSFAMIIMVPLMQLLLFGYAINTTPRDLPTAVLLQESSDLGRSILKAFENTKYFKVTRQVRDEEEFDRVLASGEVLFAIEVPASFERGCGAAICRRSWSPPTRPIRSPRARRSPRSRRWCRRRGARPGGPGRRRAGLRCPPAFPLQSGRRHPAQYRAGAARHHPHPHHADLHGPVGHPRDRARHHGEPSVDADLAGRDHARQDRTLRGGRLLAGDADRRRRLRPVPRAGARQPDAARGALHAVHRHQPRRSATPSRPSRRISSRPCRCR